VSVAEFVTGVDRLLTRAHGLFPCATASPTPGFADLLDRGLAFSAHEVLEAAWKNSADDERMLWQGLAPLAVGITHVQRGNVKGARKIGQPAIGRSRPRRQHPNHWHRPGGAGTEPPPPAANTPPASPPPAIPIDLP